MRLNSGKYRIFFSRSIAAPSVCLFYISSSSSWVLISSPSPSSCPFLSSCLSSLSLAFLASFSSPPPTPLALLGKCPTLFPPYRPKRHLLSTHDRFHAPPLAPMLYKYRSLSPRMSNHQHSIYDKNFPAHLMTGLYWNIKYKRTGDLYGIFQHKPSTGRWFVLCEFGVVVVHNLYLSTR